MSHVSQNLAALYGGAIGLTDPLLYHVGTTQGSVALIPGDGVVLCRALSSLTITLPPAGTCAGRAFLIAKIDGSPSTVTIATATPNDQINGQRSVQLTTPYAAQMVLSDGQNWWIVSGAASLANPMVEQSFTISDQLQITGSFLGLMTLAGGLTISLPTSGVDDGTQLTIVNIGTNVFTLATIGQGNLTMAVAPAANSTAVVVWSASLGVWLKLSQA